jgi:membrane-bound acyltransferase YfiQ involved in biofilm formation
VLTGAAIILLMFVIVSILDIIIAVLNARFYSNAVFITIFGVGGVFATVFAYMMGIEKANHKSETARWALISVIILLGVLFFFPLAKIEGGEYKAAFKSYGLMIALTTFVFMRGKID